jgi:pimeloyl-ACP methyl ester carboxylesterase
MKKNLALLLAFSISTIAVYAQSNLHRYNIDPDSTGNGIKKIYNGHLATVDDSKKSNHKLLIAIPGTGGTAYAFKHLGDVAAAMGYHAISIDYPNKRNTATLGGSPDKLVFNKFRQELAFGTPVSDSINIDTANSIVNRITKLVVYMAKTRPSEGWEQFLKNGNIVWDKVVVAGHSQGSGHAAYLGTKFKVHRVIMFSGPQDFLTAYDTPAPWLSGQSATAAKNYYSLLHTNDPYNTDRQTRNDLTLMHTDSTVITRFTLKPEFNSKTRIFISDAPISATDLFDDPAKATAKLSAPAAHHSSTIRPLYADVWRYLLE